MTYVFMGSTQFTLDRGDCMSCAIKNRRARCLAVFLCFCIRLAISIRRFDERLDCMAKSKKDLQDVL